MTDHRFNWHKEAEQQWDMRSNFWNQNSKDMWDSGNRSTIIPLIGKHMNPQARLLDVGCGDGYGAYKLSALGFEVVGVDISAEMVKKAKQNQSNRLSFVQGDVVNLPFESDTFDGIMVINALEWTEDPFKGLRELHRIAKKDARIFIGILGPAAGPRTNSFPRLIGEPTICNTMMPWELEQLALELDLKVIDGMGVYDAQVDQFEIDQLPKRLKQALTFMWVSVLKK
ncbi:class I SAM-dependent methyltransferase [Radiobacillus sp. PE A8.2]|uniref:class I SAM-dependent methyltransferase n=1 Tax=Radiobacillus sp. PE A8.2 TaxID=3380349 RepID=UPI00388F7782